MRAADAITAQDGTSSCDTQAGTAYGLAPRACTPALSDRRAVQAREGENVSRIGVHGRYAKLDDEVKRSKDYRKSRAELFAENSRKVC